MCNITKEYLQPPDTLYGFLIQLIQINRIHLTGQQLNTLKPEKQPLAFSFIFKRFKSLPTFCFLFKKHYFILLLMFCLIVMH